MAELLSSKVAVVEEPPRLRGIPGLPTAVAGAVGLAERGPIGEPVLVTNIEEYQRVFGAITTELGLAALGFFQNGGSTLWVVRTCHYGNPADPATVTARTARGTLLSAATPTPAEVLGASAPLALAPGAQLIVVEGTNAPVTVTFDATAGSVATPGTGPYAVVDGQTFEVDVDGGPTQIILLDDADFVDPAAATAAELAEMLSERVSGASATVDGQGHIVLASQTSGSSSRVEVRGGTLNAILGFPTTPAAGTGNVSNIAAVTVGELRQLVEATLPGVRVESSPSGAVRLRTVATGPSARLQVQGGSAAAFAFDTTLHTGGVGSVTGLLRAEGKTAGTWANRLAVELRLGSAAGTFELLVREGGVLRETHRDLRLDPQSARHVELVVNDPKRGSSLIRIVDLRVAGAAAAPQTVTLDAGDDGLVGVVDADFTGSEAGRSGLHALNTVSDLSIVFIPGRATPTVHLALLAYTEITRAGAAFAILDPPAGLTATQIVSYVAQTAGIENLTEYGAIYWPRIRVPNPNPASFGYQVDVVAPPSGAIAGVYARTDGAQPGGVYNAPAGVEVGRLLGVLGFESDECNDERKRDLVYPHRINPLRTDAGAPRYIDGSRSLKGDGNFPSIPERRGVSFIERSLRRGLEPARHRNNDERLRAEVSNTVTAFLTGQMNVGAFASRDPATAFFVEVPDDAQARFRGELHLRVGLATNKPAEFIVLHISQDTRALEAELAAS